MPISPLPDRASQASQAGAVSGGPGSSDWARCVQGMDRLAALAAGRQGEEGMRRHYLALMRICARSMSDLLEQAEQSRPT